MFWRLYAYQSVPRQSELCVFVSDSSDILVISLRGLGSTLHSPIVTRDADLSRIYIFTTLKPLSLLGKT